MIIAAIRILIGVCMKLIENWGKDTTNPSNPINKIEPAEKESSNYDLFDCKTAEEHTHTYIPDYVIYLAFSKDCLFFFV